MKRVSNYEVQCEDWRKRFLGMDQADVRRRVPELREEGAYLTLCILAANWASTGRRERSPPCRTASRCRSMPG